ncbi:MAG: L-seryl-tRNA(Sec) selenium transferase [Anaerolineales bacterium]|jgi:L-seryl-tRNA(Ser) seleniumtransferase
MTLRDLPSVDSLLQRAEAAQLIDRFGRSLSREAVRASLDLAREKIRSGDLPASPAELVQISEAFLRQWTTPSLRPVINATGVILHTNLGRAPLSRSALEAIQGVADGYSSLEYDLQEGRRGSRLVHVEPLLLRLTGASAAMVVVNNAAAILLALTTLAKGREVIISRSELIEIGDGFRVPDVMRQSGARLVEVGTSNRTHLSDFEQAIGPRTALLMRAHHSNFRIIGFTSMPSRSELARLASQHGLAMLDDLGSGALLDTSAFGLGHEPTVQESLQAGAGLVTFSGDKLLGGPQAGILLGSTDLIARLRRHPLARALRADKLCLAALQATLMHYLRDEATREIPVWQMIAARPADLQGRVESWIQRLGQGQVLESRSTIGGGSLPEESLPTFCLALDTPHPQKLMERLRTGSPPVIARIEGDRVLLDPRTILPAQEQDLQSALRSAMQVADRPALHERKA